ncbi:MAG: DUF167 domain-containing protein, partial [Actinobacteria bacterium]|nr:DUF167 domain-containing protein [Actinomycetota bacterium]
MPGRFLARHYYLRAMDIKIKVIPGSNKNRIITVSDNELRVYIKEPPVKGKANDEMIELLSKHFKVGK